MRELVKEIGRQKIACNDALESFEAQETVDMTTRCKSAAERLMRASSRSWVGYHARVYLDQFIERQPGMHFDPMWGFNDAMSATTIGPWHEYSVDVVREKFCELAQIDTQSMAALVEAAKVARSTFDDAVGALVPLLAATLKLSEDEQVREKFGSISDRGSHIGLRKIEAVYGPGDLQTRDQRAAGEGLVTPPHIKILAEVQEQLSYGTMLRELRDDLVFLEKYLAVLNADESEPEAASEKERASNEKPSVFIGSSTEGLPVAKYLQVNLDHSAEVTIWSQGVFGLSKGTLDSLVGAAGRFDFAVLVLTPDDVSIKRGTRDNSARDNVLFELGLFLGALGTERTFIVSPRDISMDTPSDLAGVTVADFAWNRRDNNLQAALGAASTKIEDEVKKLGVR